MRLFSTFLFALSVTALVAGSSLAQQPRPQPGAGGIGGLLQNESVQKELKLEKDQIDKAKEAVTKITDANKDAYAKAREITDRDEQRTKFREIGAKVSEETTKAISTVLNADQLKRLNQIELQQAQSGGGFGGFGGGTRSVFDRAEVQKALNLSDDQKEKIKKVNEETSAEMQKLFGGGGTRPDFTKIGDLRKASQEKIVNLMSDSQKKAWKDMLGEPFTIQNTGRRPGGNNTQPRTPQTNNNTNKNI